MYENEKEIINFETGLNRFVGSKDLYITCLIKFIEDKSFDLAKEAMFLKSYDKAFENLHALKGLSGNLSLDLLYDCCCNIVDELRSKKHNNLDKQFSDLSNKYYKTIEYIKFLYTNK
ncbi:Hpt domain-containing protein [Sedimentibacter sp. zth1]|uniref:Hpt domain-containing protein n=1 Tax=Sedimentibacter sp. zth1 TaxID=2816908 RepID=UPI001A91BBA0|nr:Hpt domain-containing protein [Sedimentibacter sp. zth1]QSX07067.1 Hpt domain-containing protein [Sedimentibacter sp. zth1]